MSCFVFFCWLFICGRWWNGCLGWGLVCLLLFACGCVDSVGEDSSSSYLGAWDGLNYFIVALPELSI